MAEPIKRFMVFAWEAYNENGGWGDFRGSADDLVGAVAILDALGPDYDGAYVVDAQTGEAKFWDREDGRWSTDG